MTLKEFEFQVAETTLQGQYYSPVIPKAVIILVHGMGEHSKRYEKQVVPFLLKNSMAVISYDQFGHGRSKGKPGHHPGYVYLLDSIDQMIAKANELYHDIPVFLYGHSMGGNVVINYSLKRSDQLKGVVVTSPFLRLAFAPPKWKMAFGRIIDLVIPSFTMPNEIDVSALSRDKKEIEAYQMDPLVHDRVSTRYSLEFMKTGEWAIEHASELKIPMLLLHGTKDRLTSHLASEEFAAKAQGKAELVLFEGGYHELHHDLDKEKVMGTIVDWIQKEIQPTQIK
jgi:acylglycerol lipase